MSRLLYVHTGGVNNPERGATPIYHDRIRPETPGVGTGDWVTAVLQATATAVPA